MDGARRRRRYRPDAPGRVMRYPSDKRMWNLPVHTGGVVSIPVALGGFLPIRHVGLVSDRTGWDGQPTILHASQWHGEAVETSASEFVAKRAGPLCYHGMLGKLAPGEIVTRARARLGQRYNPVTSNCEQFVTGASGENAESPQLAGWSALGIFLVGIAASITATILLGGRAATIVVDRRA